MKRRQALHLLGALPAALTASATVRAQGGHPPLRVIVPYSAGGQTDVIARAVTASMQKTLARPVIVDNRAGAGGLIAVRAMQAAAPDGNTILIQNSGIIVQPLVQKMANYDVVKDLDPVALIGSGLNVLMVTDTVPANNLADFVRYAKSLPEGLECANSGINSGGHILALVLEKMTGMELVHVAFKGSAEIATAMISGQIRMQLSVMSDALVPYVKSGKIRILGVTTKERSTLLPGVPSIGEVVPGYGFPSWLGVFSPAGTPFALRNAIASAVKVALDDPSVKARLEALYVEVRYLPSKEFGSLVERSRADTRDVIVNLLGLRPE